MAEGYLLELERRGYLQAGAFIPEVVLEHPEVVKALHDEFVHAGSDVVVAFTVSEYNEIFICLLFYLPHFMYLIPNFINRIEDFHARIKHVTKLNKIVIPYYFKAYSMVSCSSVALRSQKVGMGVGGPPCQLFVPGELQIV